MAQLADDTSPRRLVRDAAYYAELGRKLDAPIQAIPAGIGSLSPAGRPALPPWVQAKLDEQARQKAEADALRRLAPVNQPIIAPKPSTKWPKIAPSQPKPSPTVRFTAPPAPAPAPTPAPPVDRAFQRGTPEYNARINELLNARTQGIAPGYGSRSTPAEPARRTDPTPSRPFSLLSDPDDQLTAPRIPVTPPKSPRLADILRNLGSDDELAAERVSVSAPPPISPPQQPPRSLSPEDEQLAAGRALSADGLWDPDYVPERVRQTEALTFDLDEVEPMGSPARRVDWRPPEPTDISENQWLLPTEIMGVPVTVDRELVQLAHQANTIFGIPPEDQAKLDALPTEERADIEDLARELWNESQGQALAEHRGRQLGEAQPNPAFTDWKKIFELSTGYDFPDGGGLMPLGRDLLELRSGFDTMDGLTRSQRDGTLLVFGPSVGDPELLDEILSAYYPDDRARFEAVQEHYPLAQFLPDEAGFGTVLQKDIEGIPFVGDYLENFADKATAPATWMFGPAIGAASIVGGGVASNLFEQLKESGLSPEESAARTQHTMAVLFPDGWKSRGAAWAYARELAGKRIDDFGEEWIPIGPMPTSPRREVRDSLDGSTGDILGDLEDGLLAREPASSRAQETNDVWTFQRQRNSEARVALSQLQVEHGDAPPDPATYANLYAELYWSTVPLADPTTGQPDVEGWKARRQAIASEAEALGLDPTYVTGRGYGTYHEVRFLHDEVRGSVERFERAAFDGV
jgi:hypothetical protein